MPDTVELVMRFHPVGGEDVSVVLTKARYDREVGESGVVINLANVVSVRVSQTDSATTGQYL